MGCSQSKIQDGAPSVSPVVKAVKESVQEPASASPAQTEVVAADGFQAASEEHEAACKVQSVYRGHVARKHVDGIRTEKEAKSSNLGPASEGAGHAETPVPNEDAGDASVKHSVNDLQAGMGIEAAVTAAVPDEQVATADPATNPDDSTAAVVEIFGEEGANAVAAAFFDGSVAMDASEPVATGDSPPVDADVHTTAEDPHFSDAAAPEQTMIEEHAAPAEDAEITETSSHAQNADTDEAPAPNDDSVAVEEATAISSDAHLEVPPSPEVETSPNVPQNIPCEIGAGESTMPAEISTHEELPEAAPDGEGSDNVESTADEAVVTAPNEMEPSEAPVQPDEVITNEPAADSGDITIADEAGAEES